MASAPASSASSTATQAQAPSSSPIITSRETFGATSPSWAAIWRQNGARTERSGTSAAPPAYGDAERSGISGRSGMAYDPSLCDDSREATAAAGSGEARSAGG